MKKKSFKLMFCIIIMITSLNMFLTNKILSILNYNDVICFYNTASHPSNDSSILNIPTLSVKEKKLLTTIYENHYPKLVDAMLQLRNEGVISNDDIINIHKFISDLAINSSVELPHNDKDLIDYLYDNNIINDSQYERLLKLTDEKK